MKLAILFFLMSTIALPAKERNGTYGLSKQCPYAYVGVGWRFGFDVTGTLSVDGINYEIGVFRDLLGEPGDKWANVGGDLKLFADFLQRCADSVKRRKEFKETCGRLTLHYKPKDRVIEIKQDNGFIDVVIPEEEATKMHAAVRQMADDFERINQKLSPGQPHAAPDRDNPPK